VHLLEGEAGILIPKLAEEQQIDLIVMGTVARTGIEGYFIGNTAETVLNHASCSVLSVKPDGFVSPVKAD
jgi:universal stress protein E